MSTDCDCATNPLNYSKRIGHGYPMRCQSNGSLKNVAVRMVLSLMIIQQLCSLTVEAYVPSRTLPSIEHRLGVNLRNLLQQRRWKPLSSSLKEKTDSLYDPTTLPVLGMSASNEPSIVVKPQAPIVPIVTCIPALVNSDTTNEIETSTSMSSESTNDIQQLEPPKDHLQQELNIWAARGLLLLVAAIWGTNFASVKYLENLCFHPPCHHPPSEAALARFGLAALVSIPLLLKQQWIAIRAGLECGLWISLGYFTQALALSTIDSGRCAFICSLTVVFVPVASTLLYNKPVRMSNIVAAMIALAGVGVLEGMVDVNQLLGIAPAVAASHTAAAAADIVVSSGHTAVSAVSDMSTGPLMSIANKLGIDRGDILALGQPIGFGTAFLRIEQYQEELKDVSNRILTIAAAQCVAVGILAFFWVLYDFHGTLPNFSYMLEPHRIAAIGWTGIVTTVVAIFIEGIALQKATATDASLAFSTEPIWASLFGFILLHETLGIDSFVGGALILIACLVGAIADLRLSLKNGDANPIDKTIM